MPGKLGVVGRPLKYCREPGATVLSGHYCVLEEAVCFVFEYTV